jgi:hypothetical protein
MTTNQKEEEEKRYPLTDVDLIGAFQEMEKMRAQIRDAVRTEFEQGAVKAWVRHELEEILGHIIWRHVNSIAGRIIAGVEETIETKLKLGDLTVKEAKVKAVEIIADKIVTEMNLKSYYTQSELNAEIKKMTKEKIANAVEKHIANIVVAPTMEEMRAEVRAQLPNIKQAVQDMLKTQFGEMVIRQLSILLDQLTGINENIRGLNERMIEMERRGR